MARKIEIDVPGGYPAFRRKEADFEIPVLQVTDTFGVNQGLDLDDEGEVEYRKTWNVTHIPTGWAFIRGLPSQGSAKAAAEIFDAMGFGEITTDDAPTMIKEVEKRGGIANIKAWVHEQVAKSKSSKALVEKLQKEARRARRGQAPARAAKRTAPTPKQRRPKKPAAGRGRPKKPDEPMDLLEMARRARGNPEKDRLLAW